MKSNKEPNFSSRNIGWENLSKWYSGMVGDSGSKFHVNTAIPITLSLMDIKKGKNVLDIGCGNGVLAQYIAKSGGNYFGVDASNSLINDAKKRFGRFGRFYVGDAAGLFTIKEIGHNCYNYVCFLLSIQDMDPLKEIIKNASNALQKGGSLVIFMTHPAFRIPRQSGWGFDERRGLIYRRVDRYLTAEAIPLNTKAGGRFVKSYTFHRPLQNYLDEIFKNNLCVDKFVEIPTYKTNVPNNYNKYEKRAYKEFPLFLALRAVKLN